MKIHHRTILGLLAGACALLGAHTASASIYYHVTVDTSALISDPGAPFSLDFALSGGNPLGNTITLNHFSFGGGAAVGAPTTFGLATGDLTSGITLNDDSSNFFNEFFQEFTPGSTLGFDVFVTTNINSPTPDGFAFSILDQSLAAIDTDGTGDSLVLIDLNSANPTAQSFSSINPAGITVTVVPEPGTLLFGAALVGVCGITRRRRN